ncbi:flagellar hook-length control protein FliK [Allosediminivita pacifica]|uniref:flagellar hook-length control protein FliK n=1 Tax=Allosediminivita pacifica TaxID=1267769 RepID=UPI0011B28E1C|nr:flagellar hook-length control protein FliK [Allosediminivita pacifica]
MVHFALTSRGGAGQQPASHEVATPEKDAVEEAPEITGDTAEEAGEEVISEGDGEDLVDLLDPGDDERMTSDHTEIGKVPASTGSSAPDPVSPSAAEPAAPVVMGQADPMARSADLPDPAHVEARLPHTPSSGAAKMPQMESTKTAADVSEHTFGDKRPTMDTIEAGARGSVPLSMPGMGQATEKPMQHVEGSPARRNARAENTTAQRIVEARMPARQPETTMLEPGPKAPAPRGDIPVPAGMTRMAKGGAEATVRSSKSDGSAMGDADIDVRVMAPVKEPLSRASQPEPIPGTLTEKVSDQGKSSDRTPGPGTVIPPAASQAEPAASRRPVLPTIENSHAAGDPVKEPPLAQSAERSAPLREPFTALWSARTASAPARSGMTAAFAVQELREKGSSRAAEGDPQVSQFSTDLRGTPAPTQVSQTPRPEVPQQVMRQVTEVLHRLSEGGVEIQLRPEELGRVRLQMVPLDQGMTVVVSAERGETLDLMRRHIDQLARALQDLGYSGTQFSFSGGREQRPGAAGAGGGAAASAGAPDTESRPAPTPRPTPGSGGNASLDIMM